MCFYAGRPRQDISHEKTRVMNPMSGVFYQVASPSVLIVDPVAQPEEDTQTKLRSEISDYEVLMEVDYQFCCAVEGVAQEKHLWVARNQNKTGLADADLQRFKSIAWNDCVVKKFLTNKEGDIETLGNSMLSIIQNLNLQWQTLQVMGLHPKVEAAENQVVIACMESGFLPYSLDVSATSRSLRRCSHFAVFFANAVGSQIVANTGRTPGMAKTQYGTDMDYAYKEKNLYYLQSALQRNREMVKTCLAEPDNTNYIEKLMRLKIISKDSGVVLEAGRQSQAVSNGGVQIVPLPSVIPVPSAMPLQSPAISETKDISKGVDKILMEVMQINRKLAELDSMVQVILMHTNMESYKKETPTEDIVPSVRRSQPRRRNELEPQPTDKIERVPEAIETDPHGRVPRAMETDPRPETEKMVKGDPIKRDPLPMNPQVHGRIYRSEKITIPTIPESADDSMMQ